MCVQILFTVTLISLEMLICFIAFKVLHFNFYYLVSGQAPVLNMALYLVSRGIHNFHFRLFRCNAKEISETDFFVASGRIWNNRLITRILCFLVIVYGLAVLYRRIRSCVAVPLQTESFE